MNRICALLLIIFCFSSSKTVAQPYPTFSVNDTDYIKNGQFYVTACIGDTFYIKSNENETNVTGWHYYIVSYDSINPGANDSIVFHQETFSFTIDTPDYFYIQLLADGVGFANGIEFRVIYCPPTAAFTVTDSIICQNTCVNATDKSTRKPTAWAWDMPGATPNTYSGNASPPICFADTGMHTINLIVNNPGGSDTATQNIYVRPAPAPKYVQTDYTIPYGDSLTLQACASGEQYTWQACPSCDSTFTLTPTTKNTTVTGTVRTLPSCDVSCTYTILTTGVPEELMIPTAFSPNGDGINDGFGIAELSPYRKLNAFSIYNRWGELVYTTKVQDDRWDGIYKGMAQPLGTYVWYIDMTNTLTGSRKTLQGNVTLVR